MLQECKDVNWKLLDDAGLGLAPYGPAQSSLVRCSHFDTGYVNLRQVIYLRKNLILHSSIYGMMQIDSLTKLGKISYAEGLTCITDVFCNVQLHGKNVARCFVKTFHINSAV